MKAPASASYLKWPTVRWPMPPVVRAVRVQERHPARTLRSRRAACLLRPKPRAPSPAPSFPIQNPFRSGSTVKPSQALPYRPAPRTRNPKPKTQTTVKPSQALRCRPAPRTRDPKPNTRARVKASQGQSRLTLSSGTPDPRPETQDPIPGQGVRSARRRDPSQFSGLDSRAIRSRRASAGGLPRYSVAWTSSTMGVSTFSLRASSAAERAVG